MSQAASAAASSAASSVKTGLKGVAGIVGLSGVADIAEGNGLDMASAAAGAVADRARQGLERAEKAAGDVLRDIFGGLPWQMSPSEIVNAVAGGGEGANQAAGLIVDAVGVIF